MKMMTRDELASKYGIHRNTLSKRISEFNIESKLRLTPKDLNRIFEELGEPPLEESKPKR
jgi:hypothetical protein